MPADSDRAAFGADFIEFQTLNSLMSRVTRVRMSAEASTNAIHRMVLLVGGHCQTSERGCKDQKPRLTRKMQVTLH